MLGGGAAGSGDRPPLQDALKQTNRREQHFFLLLHLFTVSLCPPFPRASQVAPKRGHGDEDRLLCSDGPRSLVGARVDPHVAELRRPRSRQRDSRVCVNDCLEALDAAKDDQRALERGEAKVLVVDARCATFGRADGEVVAALCGGVG